MAKTAKRRRGDKRDRTRAALIEAAGRLVSQRGYEKTTLEAVAASVGMSRGAIYGNFKNRDELFLAMVRAKWTPIVAPFTPGVSLSEQMRIAGRFAYRAALERRPQAAAAAAFRLYVTQNPQLRDRLAKENAAILKRIADTLDAAYGAGLPMSASAFARSTFALTEGLVFAYFSDPPAYPETLFVDAFEALAGAPKPAPERNEPSGDQSGRT